MSFPPLPSSTQRWTHVVGPIGDGEVDIKVVANGLCHSDISMRDNEWGISAVPFIPGHEVRVLQVEEQPWSELEAQGRKQQPQQLRASAVCGHAESFVTPHRRSSQVVGIVHAVGKAVKTLEMGQRVGVGWIGDSCRKCPNCLRGNENICLKGYRGLIVAGEQAGGMEQGIGRGGGASMLHSGLVTALAMHSTAHLTFLCALYAAAHFLDPYRPFQPCLC